MATDMGSPASHGAAITGNDGTDLSSPARSLYIGVAGNLTVQMYPNGELVTFTNVPVGILPVQVKRLMATGLSASGIVALW